MSRNDKVSWVGDNSSVIRASYFCLYLSHSQQLLIYVLRSGGGDVFVPVFRVFSRHVLSVGDAPAE